MGEVREEKELRYSDEYYFRLLNKDRYILLYDEISVCSAEMVVSKLRAMDKLDHKKPIYLEINSPGGGVSSGITIIDTIQAIRAPVYTLICGEACSMAAMISIVGKKRYITPHSVFMQHSLSDMVGDYLNHIKDRTNFLVKLEKQMDAIIQERTKLNTRQRAQIRNGELWLFAEEALQYGVVDEILYPKKK